MRIYIVAAHSLGKTTLARYISNKYSLTLLNEVARTVLAEKELSIDSLRTSMQIVNEYQQDVFYRQLKEEESKDNFVSDRGFDNLAYAAMHSDILSALLSTDLLKNYINQIKTSNSIVFFIRPNKELLKQDGTRETLSWDGVVAIDAMIKFMLEMWQIRHFQINTPSMQERVRLVDAVIDLSKTAQHDDA